MTHIYILQLEHDKYYVGRTNNLEFRLNDHFQNNGSVWTKKYKPLSIVEIINNCDNYDEDKYTIKYMEKFGINNVRGGSFCEIILNEQNIEMLTKFIRNANDKCYICGMSDHFANNCASAKKENNLILKNPDEKCDCVTSYFSPHRRKKCALMNIINFFDDEYANINRLISIGNVKNNNLSKKECTCYRCGREGHFANSCYAKKHIKGYCIDK